MIPTLIFSKDRPCQLHATLHSIYRHMPWIAPTILYKASEPQYEEGYQILIKDDYEQTSWLSEGDFECDVRNFIQKSTSTSELIMFLTDDDVVYRKPEYKYGDIVELFSLKKDIGTFSNRLGHNTWVQNPHNRGERVIWPEMVCKVNQFTVWPWVAVPCNTNFGYPLSVDGNIFRIDEILDVIEGLKFTQPNEFEGKMQSTTYLLPPGMACSDESCVVGIPVNRVQDFAQNRAGEDYGMTPSELNERFLSGERIKLDKMDFSDICGAHQEVKLILE